jgi:hypothetical protein
VYVRPTLAMVMADRLHEAAAEMPTTSPVELFDRFLAWTRGPSAS